MGLLVFVMFVVTGQYMSLDFPDKDAMSQELRVLMRSRHIYILFSALIHLVLGVYIQISLPRWRQILQYSGSVVLLFSSALLVWAFFAETYSTQHNSSISFFGIIFSLAGVGLHLIGGLPKRNTDR